MGKMFARLRKDERGVAAIEFAIIVPLLAIILMGMVDYSMYISKALALQQLADQSDLYVIEGGSTGKVGQDVIQQSSLYTTAPSVTYTTQTDCECANGNYVSCSGSCSDGSVMRSFFSTTITGTYTPLLPWPGLPSTITLTGYARMEYAR